MKSNVISLLSAATMTGTAEVDSSPILIDQIYGFAIQAIWTGTPNGSIKLQCSCDPVSRQSQTANGGPYTVTNWTDVTSSSQSISGTAGSYVWNVNGSFYNFVRLVYVNTSSTGLLSANMVVKG